MAISVTLLDEIVGVVPLLLVHTSLGESGSSSVTLSPGIRNCLLLIFGLADKESPQVK